MNQLVTPAIVLRRLNYGEADRIITVLTPEQGKLSLIAKGVRRPKSKLAGGIELFSVSNLTYMTGRSDLGRLISARLERHYEGIVKQLDRVQAGYEFIKLIDTVTADQPEPDYFVLLQTILASLNMPAISLELIGVWTRAQLLRLGGNTPNLRTAVDGQPLNSGQTYRFDLDAMALEADAQGKLAADHIKCLRLLFAETQPAVLQKVQGLPELLAVVRPLVEAMALNYLQP